MGRFFIAFAVGCWLAIAFWGSLAPHSEHTAVALDAMPSYIYNTVCGGFGYPTSVTRLQKESSYTLYQVSCSAGTEVPISW